MKNITPPNIFRRMFSKTYIDNELKSESDNDIDIDIDNEE